MFVWSIPSTSTDCSGNRSIRMTIEVPRQGGFPNMVLGRKAVSRMLLDSQSRRPLIRDLRSHVKPTPPPPARSAKELHLGAGCSRLREVNAHCAPGNKWQVLPGRPVARNLGPLRLSSGLLWAYHLRLCGFLGSYFMGWRAGAACDDLLRALRRRTFVGPRKPHKHKYATKHDFWYLPSIGPWNQIVRSFCLCDLLGPQLRPAPAMQLSKKLCYTLVASGSKPQSGLLSRILIYAANVRDVYQAKGAS